LPEELETAYKEAKHHSTQSLLLSREDNLRHSVIKRKTRLMRTPESGGKVDFKSDTAKRKEGKDFGD
jgi:hypothetical protein